MSIWVEHLRNRRRAVTVRDMQALDRHAILRLGIPGSVLMENAGRGIAEVALEVLNRRQGPVIVLCGKGNNGGDGFVTARYLWSRGLDTRIWALATGAGLSGDARLHYEIVRRLRIPIVLITPKRLRAMRQARVGQVRLLVDALLGTGLSRPVQEPYRSVIAWMNDSRKRILSADVPSGLDADSGAVLGVAVRAYATATCAYPKRGFFMKQGPRHVGRLFIIDIGLPQKR